MFNSYEFSFNGESCLMHGVMLYDIGGRGQEDVAFGNKASIVETRTARRIRPIHYGVKYNEDPLQFRLVFGAERPLDRYELEEIALWLTGHQDYKWLVIEQSDTTHLYYHCLITNLTPISYGWLNYAFEATVTCDCPYAYGDPFEETYEINGKTDILFRNNGSVRDPIRPLLTFIPKSGTTKLSIVNNSDDGRQFVIDGIPEGSNVTVDNVNGVITESTHGYNLYEGFNMNLFRLVLGDNELEVEGDGELTIAGHCLHNAAG